MTDDNWVAEHVPWRTSSTLGLAQIKHTISTRGPQRRKDKRCPATCNQPVTSRVRRGRSWSNRPIDHTKFNGSRFFRADTEHRTSRIHLLYQPSIGVPCSRLKTRCVLLITMQVRVTLGLATSEVRCRHSPTNTLRGNNMTTT